MQTIENVSPRELIRDMPAAVRPITRLETLGVEALQDNELLAIALRLPSLEAAAKLMVAAPAKDLLGYPLRRLAGIRGVGRASAASLLAACELTRRADQSPAALPTIRTTSDVASQCLEIIDKKKEYLLAFFLNARHQLIVRETISVGTLTASLAHPREIFAPAIGKAAAGVILVHNHPSGDPAPSDEDNRLTQRIAQAGRIMGIDLLDHLIVAAGGSYSFKTSGVL